MSAAVFETASMLTKRSNFAKMQSAVCGMWTKAKNIYITVWQIHLLIQSKILITCISCILYPTRLSAITSSITQCFYSQSNTKAGSLQLFYREQALVYLYFCSPNLDATHLAESWSSLLKLWRARSMTCHLLKYIMLLYHSASAGTRSWAWPRSPQSNYRLTATQPFFHQSIYGLHTSCQ